MIYSSSGGTKTPITSLGSQLKEQWTWVFPETLLQHNKPSHCHSYNQYWSTLLSKTLQNNSKIIKNNGHTQHYLSTVEMHLYLGAGT